MLKILHVYKDYHPILGGIENHIKTLAEAQAASGHQVTVLVTNPGREVGRGSMNGVEVIRARRLATVASTPLSPAFPLLLRRQQPDITHLHFPYPVGEVSQWLLGKNRPAVVTYHSDVVKQQTMLRLYNPLLKRVLGSVDKIIVGSDNYIQSSPYLRPLAGKCVQIPFSVDVTRFQNAAPLFPPNHKPTLLFLGRHRYYKGVDDLIRALPNVHARLFIGGDGPMRPSWESLVREMNLADRVQFVGDVRDEDLPGFYASGDVFVLPANSRAEAFGKVLLEAMATGLPCVTTELGTGTSYLVQDGISGYVIPPRRPEALARALNRLLSDRHERRQMGQTGQKRVQQTFTPERMVSRVMAVYEQVLNKL